MPDPRLLSEEELAGIQGRVARLDERQRYDPNWISVYALNVPRLLAHIAAVTEQRDEAVKALRHIANPLPCDCSDGVSECYCMTEPTAIEIAAAALDRGDAADRIDREQTGGQHVEDA